MTYELSLEYGSFPVKVVDAFATERKEAPSFLQGNTELLEKLEQMNALFHELFLTIECTFHYVGSNFPDKIEQLRGMYQEVANQLTQDYPDQDITIEYFIL